LISEDTRVLIRYRMEQAEEALADAVSLLDRGSLRAVVNRAYYAMFYAVLALLNLLGKGTSKHSGAIALFDREFVKGGAFAKESSMWLHEGFLQRQRADYDELITVCREEAVTAVEHARGFVEQVNEYLAGRLGTSDE